MDLWVVAAAAAAGYLGKYWQKVSGDSDSLSDFSSGDPKYGRPEDVLAVRRKKSEVKASDSYQLDEALPNEMISSSGGRLGVYSKRDVFSLSSTLPDFFNNGDNEDRNGLTSGASDNYRSSSVGGISGKSSHDYVTNRSSIRSKRRYQRVVKPLNSIESCLMAQLYKEHIKMEEYVLNSLPLQSTPTTMRPLLVTDGRKVISKVSGDSFNCKLSNEVSADKNGFAFGVSSQPKNKHFDPLKKINVKTGKACEGKLSSSNQMVSGTHFHSQDSHGGMALFSLGISIGMMSSVIANKRELEKLKELIKQRENLVQDLQEEIEMKDALTVKELANENYESRGNSYFSDREPNPSPPKENMANSTYYTESYDGKADEITDSMSKIEAELEAELERLGLNINTSEFMRRTSENIQIEPDFVADFAQGELRADKIDRQAVASNQDRDGTSTPYSGNYTVSPRELSLRLHEVIQSRLLQRIEELETALLKSRIKVQTIESECMSPRMKLCDEKTCDLVLTPESREFSSITQPLVIHLSGEALDAYGETYEELMKINESDEEGEIYERGMSWSRNDFENGVSSRCTYSEETSEEFFPIQLRSMQDDSGMVQELFDFGSSEDDSNSNCDEEKQLIKQIVEKTKKGSSVVLNAQKVLFSMGENYNFK